MKVEDDLHILLFFSVLNRTWETVKRTGNKKGVTADGKTLVICLFVCLHFFL